MHSHTLVGWGSAAVIVLLNASVALADEGAPALPPDRAVALAVAAHPDLRAAETVLSTAEASRSASALFLSNPSTDAWVTHDGSRAELGLGQPVSLTGEGWHARRGARFAVDASSATLDRARRRLAADVRLAYVDAVVAAGVVDVARDGSDLAGRLSFAVRRKHEEGEASALELRLARLSEVQAAARLLHARRDQADALRALSALVLTPVAAEDIVQDPLSVAPPVREPAPAHRADVAAAEAALNAARAELRRARAAAIPPLTVGVGADVENGSMSAGPSVSMTFPLFDRNQTGRAQAIGGVHVAEGRLSSIHAMAETEQVTSMKRLEEAEAAAHEVAEADLEEARAALASIESGVLAGEIDLSTAVLLQTQVLDGEAAVVTLRGLLADARIDRLLALDDDALLGGGS